MASIKIRGIDLIIRGVIELFLLNRWKKKWKIKCNASNTSILFENFQKKFFFCAWENLIFQKKKNKQQQASFGGSMRQLISGTATPLCFLCSSFFLEKRAFQYKYYIYTFSHVHCKFAHLKFAFICVYICTYIVM